MSWMTSTEIEALRRELAEWLIARLPDDPFDRAAAATRLLGKRWMRILDTSEPV